MPKLIVLDTFISPLRPRIVQQSRRAVLMVVNHIVILPGRHIPHQQHLIEVVAIDESIKGS